MPEIRGTQHIMAKKWVCSSFRLAVLYVATIIVFLVLYFMAKGSQWTYIGATDIEVTKHPYYSSSLTGYLLALTYGGQQGAGVRALAILQRWVKNAGLSMLIVEPFIKNSVLETYGNNSQQSIKFSDMFDLKNFNRVSRSEGVTELVPWETYVTRAPPDAILVRIRKFQGPEPVPSPAVLWSSQPGSGKCWQSEDGYTDVWINNKRLCYIRVVQVPFNIFTSHTFTAKKAHTIILADLNPTTVNIVFEQWCAPWMSKSPLFSSAAHPSHNLKDVRNTSVFLTQILHDSPRLLRDVENYQKQFLKTSFYVAVMLRVEHSLLMLNARNKGKIEYNIHAQLQNCLDDVVNKTNMAMAKVGTKSVFVTADIDLYGSSSWQKTASRTHLNARQLNKVEKQAKAAVVKLYNKQWTFKQWEKSFSQATGGVEDKGYIAAVQRGLASQASCLILLGGGEFHTLALRGYVDRTDSRNRCIDLVCIHRYMATNVLYAVKDG